MSSEENKQGNYIEEVKKLYRKIYDLKIIHIATIALAIGVTLILLSYIKIIPEPAKEPLRSLGIALVPGGFITIMIEKSTKSEYADIVKNEIKNVLQKIIPEEISKILNKSGFEVKDEMTFKDLRYQLLTKMVKPKKKKEKVSDIKLNYYICLTDIYTKPNLLAPLVKHFANFIKEQIIRENDDSNDKLQDFKVLCPDPEYNAHLASHVAVELNLPSVSVRAEEKRNKGKNFYDGAIQPKDKFILLNDVTLTGKTAVERINKIKEKCRDIEVKWAFAVFERTDEGANYRDTMNKRGIKFSAMNKIDDKELHNWRMKGDRGNSKP